MHGRRETLTKNNWDVAQLPSCKGRSFICAGAGIGNGIGNFVAEQLATTDAHVVLSGRTDQKLQTAIVSIRQRVPDARLSSLTMDLADLASINAGVVQLIDLVSGLDGAVFDHPDRIDSSVGRQARIWPVCRVESSYPVTRAHIGGRAHGSSNSGEHVGPWDNGYARRQRSGACARPIPELPPVTRATFPVNCPMITSVPLGQYCWLRKRGLHRPGVGSSGDGSSVFGQWQGSTNHRYQNEFSQSSAAGNACSDGACGSHWPDTRVHGSEGRQEWAAVGDCDGDVSTDLRGGARQ